MKIIIVGGGKVGAQLAKECRQLGYQVALIEYERSRGEKLRRELGIPVVIGDGTDPQVMKAAGAEEVDIVVAVTDDDQDNLIVCQQAERRFKAKRTLALVNNPGNEKLFSWLGVNQVIGPTSLILGLIQGTVDMQQTTTLWMQGIKDLKMIQVKINPGAPAVNLRVRDLNLPNQCILVTIVRGETAIVPGGNTCIKAGDLVFALTHPSVEAEVEKVLVGTKLEKD
ncbi:MAG TPA: potassium transporter [Peptococcaceae bacterium]|nr:MAG: TrkA [Moorella sp. 60_41]HBT47230.1 potassium transporter [Peptococcaceae bacterium]